MDDAGAEVVDDASAEVVDDAGALVLLGWMDINSDTGQLKLFARESADDPRVRCNRYFLAPPVNIACAYVAKKHPFVWIGPYSRGNAYIILQR
jgi:hypothetical protein